MRSHPFWNYHWERMAIGDEVIRYLVPTMCECVAKRMKKRGA